MPAPISKHAQIICTHVIVSSNISIAHAITHKGFSIAIIVIYDGELSSTTLFSARSQTHTRRALTTTHHRTAGGNVHHHIYAHTPSTPAVIHCLTKIIFSIEIALRIETLTSNEFTA